MVRGRRRWHTYYVKCFKWLQLPFQQQTACFLFTRAQAVKKKPWFLVLGFWKMYKTMPLIHLVQVLWRTFLKDILSADYSLITSLKSAWIFHFSEILVHHPNWFSQSRSAVCRLYPNTGLLVNLSFVNTENYLRPLVLLFTCLVLLLQSRYPLLSTNSNLCLCCFSVWSFTATAVYVCARIHELF